MPFATNMASAMATVMATSMAISNSVVVVLMPLLRSSFLKSLRRVYQAGCSDGMVKPRAPSAA